MMMNCVDVTRRTIIRHYDEHLEINDLFTKAPSNDGNFDNKMDHINHVFNSEEVLCIKQNWRLLIMLNIPSITLGYFKGEYLVSMNEYPMTKGEILNLAHKGNLF